MIYEEDKPKRFEFQGAYLPGKWWEIVTFVRLPTGSFSSQNQYGFYTKWGKAGCPGSKSKPKIWNYGNYWARDKAVKKLIDSKLKKRLRRSIGTKERKRGRGCSQST